MKISIKEMQTLFGRWKSPNFIVNADQRDLAFYNYIKGGSYIDTYTLFKLWNDKNMGVSKSEFYTMIENTFKEHGDYLINTSEVEIEPIRKYTYEIYGETVVNTKKNLLIKIDEMVDDYNPIVNTSHFKRVSETAKDYSKEEEYEIFHPITGERLEYSSKDECYDAKNNIIKQLKEDRRKQLIENTKQLIIDKNDNKVKLWIKYNG